MPTSHFHERAHQFGRALMCTFLIVAWLVGGDVLAYLNAAQQLDAELVVHPTPENIPKVTDPRFILTEQLRADTFWFAHKTQDDPQILTLGLDRGGLPIDALIETPDQVRLGAENRLFLLVRSMVVELDYDKNLIDYFGFFSRKRTADFSTLSVTDAGNTVVLTDRSTLAYVYERSKGGFALTSVLDLQRSTSSACAINDHLFVLGYKAGDTHVIHKYTLDGQQVLSFGDAYRSDDETFRALLSGRGELTCSVSAGVVAWLPRNVPVLHGFSVGGDLLWQVLLANYTVRPEVINVYSTGESYLWTPFNTLGYSWLRYMSADRDGWIHLSYNTRWSREGWGALNSFAIDATTGLGTYTGAGLPFATIDRNHAVYIWIDW